MSIGIFKSFGERIRLLVDLIFGYDFFISYAHADGMQYPRVLAVMLKRMGYTVFLDTEGYQAGTDLRVATRRRIRMSRKLVVIAREQALVSGWVEREVQTCLDAHRAPVVIDINHTLGNATADVPVKQMLEDRLCIRESMPDVDGEPSAKTVQQLHQSYTATRREVTRLRIVSAACIVLLVAAVIAINQSRIAELRRRDADQQRNIAKEERQRADREREEALRQRDAAVSRLLVLDAKELSATRPAASLLVAAAAARHESSFQTRNLLLSALFATRNLKHFLHGDGEPWTVVSLSVDGAVQITADASRRLRLWTREDSRLRLTELGDMPFRVTSLALSDDARLIAVGGESGDVLIVRAATGASVRHWPKAHRSEVTGLAFNAGATRLVSGSEATELYMWDLDAGQQLGQLAQHKSGPTALAFDSTGRWLASAAEAGRVLLWDLQSAAANDGKIRHTVLDHEGSGFVHALAFSADGKTLAAGGESKAVTLWDVNAPSVRRVLGHHQAPVRALAFRPAGSELVSAAQDGEITVWHPAPPGYKGMTLRSPGPGITTAVSFVHAAAGGGLVSSGPGDFALKWSLTHHTPITRSLPGHAGGVNGLLLDAAGSSAVSFGCAIAVGPLEPCPRWALQRWRLNPAHASGTPIEIGSNRPRAIAFAGSNDRLLVLNRDRSLTLWDLERRDVILDHPAPAVTEPLPAAPAPESDANALRVPTALRVALTTPGPLAMSGMPDGRPCGTHNAGFDAVAFTADASAMIIGGANGCVALWRAESGWSTEPIMRRDERVTALALSAAGDRLATGGPNGALSVWDTTTHSLIGEYVLGAPNEIKRLAFSADSTRLAVAGRGSTPTRGHGYLKFDEGHGFLALWDVDKQQVMTPRPPRYPAKIRSLAFSADGTLAVTGRCNSGKALICPRGVIELWDVNAGLQLGPALHAQRGNVLNLELSGDARVLASSTTGASILGGDDRIFLWQLDTPSWIKAACKMANRQFSAQEAKRYFVDVYGSPCS